MGYPASSHMRVNKMLTRNHQILSFTCHYYVIAIVFIVLINNAVHKLNFSSKNM
jgi:hypothetical protein